jgi:transcriptional regulator with XRE-family HTH domain
VKLKRSGQNRLFYVSVGRRIANAREGRLTQEALAQKTALSRTAIVNIEKGRQQILFHTIVAIATALAMPITDLVPEGDAMGDPVPRRPQGALLVESRVRRSTGRPRVARQPMNRSNPR